MGEFPLHRVGSLGKNGNILCMLALPSPPQGEEKKIRLEMPETESAWKNQRLFVGKKIGIVWQTVSQIRKFRISSASSSAFRPRLL